MTGRNVPKAGDPPSRLWRWSDTVARRVFLLAAAPSLLSLFARWHWLLDNLTSFLVQYAAAAMACVAAFLLLRRPWWTAAACVVVAIHVARLWPEPRGAVGGAGEPLTIVSANVHYENKDFQRVLRFAREARPDVLLVLEFNSAWAEALEPLREELPYAMVAPRGDPFGIALFSRLPFEDSEIVAASGTRFPTVIARVEHDGRLLTVIGTHPPPPVHASAARERNAQFDELSKRAREAKTDVVLMGDLNISPWSPHFGDLLRESNLSDSRAGFGVHPTWPMHRPPLLTPIDHILISEGLTVLDRRVGPEIGSDHLPVTAVVAFRRN